MSKLVLIVEDDVDNITAIGQIIRFMLGHQILVAVDGKEAIDTALQFKPDLILMDLSLPQLSGWQATQILKQNDDLKHIPVIALTAHAMVGDKERALAAGCDDFFTKPIDIEAFIELIGKYLPVHSHTNGHATRQV